MEASRRKDAPHLAHLDMARGLAALAVALGHLRNFLFVDFPQLDSPNPWDRLFYFMTGLGRESVMVFFVLSGYLIGGSVLKNLAEGKWSWPAYLSNRLSRLWAVLVPALLLGLFWDRMGFLISGGAGYDGRWGVLVHSGPAPATAFAGGFGVLLGNAFFLQTVACPVFGTNTPLWSLANEFWYYLLFPLLAVGLARRTRWGGRLLLLSAAGALFFLLPKPLLAAGAVWLMGAAASQVPGLPALDRLLRSTLWGSCALLGLLAVLGLAKAGRLPNPDYWIGAAFAGALPFLASRRPPAGAYTALSGRLSKVSYSLYLVHFPLMAFYFYSFSLPRRIAPSPSHYLLFALFSAAALAYAFLAWYLFERRTPWLRAIFQKSALALGKTLWPAALREGKL